jgi:hypothetical protein
MRKDLSNILSFPPSFWLGLDGLKLSVPYKSGVKNRSLLDRPPVNSLLTLP